MCYGLTKKGTKCKMITNCRWHRTESCPICIDLVPIKEQHKTSCGHFYHTACIMKWYETSDECPVCRHDESTDPIIVFKHNVKTIMEEVYMDAIHSLEHDIERLRRRRVRRDD